MKEVVTFLSENPVQYLATVGRDGKATIADFSGNPPKQFSL